MKGMKKITLSVVLIVALLLVPGFIFATDNVTEVADAEALLKAVKSSGTVKLTGNIDLDERLLIDKGVNVTLDLNGKTLNLPESSNYVLSVRGDLTITGNGTINVNGLYGIGTSTTGGNLTIENGTFNGTKAIYLIADFGGKVVIEDGTFNAWFYTVNGLDEYSKNDVEIKGGTFNTQVKLEDDPITEEDDRFDQNVIAGHVLVSKGTFNRIIRGENIAENADINIKLEDNMDLANLWRPTETTETITIPNGSKVAIDLNGHTISGKQKLFDVKGAELTITGTGTIRETQPYFAPIYVSGDSSVETAVNIGENVTLQGWSGVMVASSAANAKGIIINVDGKINAIDDIRGGNGAGIYINGGVEKNDIIDVNLSSSVKINSTGTGIYAAGYADWNINESVINGVIAGLGIKAGKFDINNATITATGEDKTPTAGYGNGINASGAAIQIESNDYGGYAGNIKIDIEGGKYESKNGIAFYEYLAIEKDDEGNIKKETKQTKVTSLNITNGEFISEGSKPVFAVSNDFASKITKFIKGGTYNSDVSDYIAEGYYAGKQANGTYLVKQIVDISNSDVSGIADKIYTGKELTQNITVKYNDQELKSGTDYTVSYKNNTAIGTATVVITGKGYYKGTITETFKINPISIKNIKVTGIVNKTYNGKGLTQNITVTLDGKTLKNGTDYTVSYSNNTKPGKATVKITGKGIYEGTITKTFIIYPKKVSVSAKTQAQTTITLKWGKSTGASGYEIYMATSKNGKYTKIKTVTKDSTVEYKKSGLKVAKTYYFKARPYVNIGNTKYYGSYSSVLTTSTKTKTPSVKLTAGDKKITLKWNKVTGATGYEIYMATSKNGKYTKIKTITKGSTVKYTKTGLKANKKYYFKVRAYRTVNKKKVYSSYSKLTSTTTKKVHVVKKGDNLYRIAKKYKTTVAKLTKINKIKKASLIKIGLRLLLN